jgi:hypothetical protein
VFCVFCCRRRFDLKKNSIITATRMMMRRYDVAEELLFEAAANIIAVPVMEGHPSG